MPRVDEPFEGTPKFSVIQRELFDTLCVMCHYGPNAAAGLNLMEASSYSDLLNTPAFQAPNLLLVAPGDPDNSYFMIKLVGGDPRMEWTRMPRNGSYLKPKELEYIRQWILQGAVDDRGWGE